jgi:hypothetical protein
MTTELDYKQFIKTSLSLYKEIEKGEICIDKPNQDISKPPSPPAFPRTREPNYSELIDGIKILKENKSKQRVIIKEGHMCHYILYLERSDTLYKLCEIDTTHLDKFPKDYFI